MQQLSERFRDIWLWPLNLLRDGWQRLSRLAALFWHSIKAFFPFILNCIQEPSIAAWQRRGGVFAAGLHQLAAALFDLIGGPELVQWGMRWLLFVETRPLSVLEQTAVASVLGADALRYQDVRIAQRGLLRWIFKWNGQRAFATWHTVWLPERPEPPLARLGLIVHEVTHLFQYEQVGSRYIGEALYVQAKQGAACYEYGGRVGLVAAQQAGRAYCHFNREQQAQLAEHYYILRARGADTAVYEPFIAALRAAHFDPLN